MPRRQKRKSRREQRKDELLAQQGNRCYYCRDPFKGSGDKLKAPTVEHLERQADGGTWQEDNLVLACKECNSHRGNHSPEVWKKICKDVINKRKMRAFENSDRFEDLLRHKGEIPRVRVKMRLVEVVR